MQFNSYTFALFFGGVVLAHHLPLPWRIRKANLLAASYVFYAAWNPPFVVLLWISTVGDWFVARGIFAAKSRARRRMLVGCSLALNLGLLGFFKYGGFLVETLQALAAAAGASFTPAKPDIVLPVAISFYTFQTLSYTLDVYRGHARPWSSFLDYALYVTFLPQLVAGPIVRSSHFLPQCLEPRRATPSMLGLGAAMLTLGLFEKVVLADGLLAPVADALFDSGAPPAMWQAWCGTLAFAGQIFCDFAGYSTCAIGAALCLGFTLPANFRFPYAAIGFSDFWRRWHVSLSTWLRDYLYVPLGGNRHGRWRTARNLMITMLLGGLWHGASWTFVAWGGLHGLYLIVERGLRARFGGRDRLRQPAAQLAAMLATFAAVCFAWVFFRAGTFERAFTVAGAMLGFGSDDMLTLPDGAGPVTTAVMSGMLLVHVAMRERTLEEVAQRVGPVRRGVVLGLMVVAIALSSNGVDRAFLYFRF